MVNSLDRWGCLPVKQREPCKIHGFLKHIKQINGLWNHDDEYLVFYHQYAGAHDVKPIFLRERWLHMHIGHLFLRVCGYHDPSSQPVVFRHFLGFWLRGVSTAEVNDPRVLHMLDEDEPHTIVSYDLDWGMASDGNQWILWSSLAPQTAGD